MTLFLTTPTRRYEISDVYVMALSLILFFVIGRIFKAVVEKQKQKNAKTLPNPRGGTLELEVTDDRELALTILSCIDDNERYLVKDPKLIKVIFSLVKEKIKNESLVLTPNMMRFLALKLLNNDQSFLTQIGNVVVSSNNRARFMARISGAAVIGFVGGIVSSFAYAILMMILYFNLTENCAYKCQDHFEHLPKEGPVRIYGEKSTGHLTIAGNDDARQIEIYIPSKSSKASDSEIISNSQKIKKTTIYTRSRKKAKQVKFSDFRKTDPVLSTFKDLEEPDVPQKICPINDVHDIIAIE